MDLREGIISAARELGISPFDLATVISYETGGTFDPLKLGPTTRWGQHRGLIQFGEPQAVQHGVNWDDPLGSQLGPQGAIVSYLRSSGLKPGMNLLDLYSTINAGAPGLYNRSDTAAGGAPGTVRDKVEQQMEGHKRKAAALLGGEYIPTYTSQPRISTQGGAAPMNGQPQPAAPRGLLGLFGPREDDPRSPAERRRDILSNLAIGLSGLSMFPNTAMINALQGGIEDRREMRKEALAAEKALQSKSRTVEWLRSQGREDLAAAVEAGALDGKSAAGLAFERREPGYTTMTGKQLNEQFGVQLPEAELYNVSGKGQITKVGGAGTTITMPGAEKAWDKGIGEYGVKVYERIQDEARAAGDMLNSAAQLEALMADPNFRSGALSEPMMAGKKIIEALGGDPANVSSMEAFKSVTGRLILDSMGGSLGAGFSEGDRKFVEGVQPSLDASMEGNRLILSMQRAIAARRQQIAEFADNYVAENGMLDARFNAALRKWAEANPLFTQGASAGSYFGGNP